MQRMSHETSITSTSSEETPRQHRGLLKPWKPGQSGNPAGRPKGARSKLSEAFIADMLDAWQRHGPEVLDRVAADDPPTFLRVYAQVMPKQIEATIGVFADAQSFADAFALAVDVIGGDRDKAMRRLRQSTPQIELDAMEIESDV